MRKVFSTTVLSCSPEVAWAEVQKPALLQHVAAPLAIIRSVDPAGFPARWAARTTYRCKSHLFGFIPIGERTVFIERVDPASRQIQSRESDPLIKRWDHLISVRPNGDGQTLYSDEVDIDAGPLTYPVWLWASWFYRHRHRRWRKLARVLPR